MKQTLFVGLLLAALPVTTVAQDGLMPDPQGWGPRLRATPFVGFGPGFHSKGALSVAGGNELITDSYDFEYGSGPVAGLNLELRIHSRYSLLASGTWSRRAETLFPDADTLASDFGSDFWTGRVAAAIRLREQDDGLQFRSVSALVFAGPAIIVEKPELGLGSAAEWRDEVTHWGVNAGAEAEVPLTSRYLSLTAGFEDTMMFWNAEGLERHLRQYYQNEHGVGAIAQPDPDISHMIIMRLGLSFRFGG